MGSAGARRAMGAALAAALGGCRAAWGRDVVFSDWDCVKVPRREAVLDWEGYFGALGTFLEAREGKQVETKVAGALKMNFKPEVGRLVDLSWELVEGSAGRAAARRQCPIGLLCMCIVEAVSLTAMHTGDVDSRFGCIQDLMAEVPIYALAGSKWPVFRLYDMFWLLNKASGIATMNRFVRRQYADMAFTPEELAPFGQGVSVPWSSWLQVGGDGDIAVGHPRLLQLTEESRGRFNAFGPMLVGLVAGVQHSVTRDGRPGADGEGRPLIKVSLVYGEAWAELALAAWARWAAVGVRASVFVAMDAAALRKCREHFLVCVPTSFPSVLHKYTITALAMHLGVDVLYCDMDAVPLGGDPVGAILREAAAQGDAELAVSTHNYNCMNAGVWYARASGATAGFFLTLLEYLYEHWYEGDQRAMNALALGNVTVSYMGEYSGRVPALRVAVLPPDEIAGPEGFASKESVLLFHAYKVYGEEKLALVRDVYGVSSMPPEARDSRKLMWQWYQDEAAQASARAAALRAIARYEKPRESSECW